MSHLLELDVNIVPYTYRSSCFSVSRRGGTHNCLTRGSDTYLISHCRPFGVPIVALRPVLPGQPLPDQPARFHRTAPSGIAACATPSALKWYEGQRIVSEAVFLNVRCIRFRGTVPFALDTDQNADRSAYIYTNPPYCRGPPPFHPITALKGLVFYFDERKRFHQLARQTS
ncbi:hypothetical protein JDV02_004619 [Purpureocillium takamizusanense]|uniref:Uncharacterized protein n=1 Tax=Purpureocillium takamizusanense TaxID=2060973 RepID=A0A9Q8QGC2_9HYPO|nr:uncharacterized protein JDV02_004619 [Purpureocillium takamizusanense]UNI18346.1 hypothetical protein JDV02_004619 [Purpureocillium takamizusanense]